QAISQNNDQPQETHVLPFLSETVTIPAVIIPENGQPFSTTFDRPRYLDINIQELNDRVTVPAQEEQREREAAGGETQEERRKKQIQNIAREALNEQVEEGMIVYRVYGPPGLTPEENITRLYRRSWTNLDPRIAHFLVPTNPNVGPKSLYRILAGLPNANTGECLAIGELVIKQEDFIKPADVATQRAPDPDDYRWQEGGWPELVILNSTLRVRVRPGHECIRMNPPF
ncbi:MAG: hypothetical protein HY747_01575, partial [Elusimicrobia bacterium]|nr:hypothetical protein [Elusimicrobiota bacterium]